MADKDRFNIDVTAGAAAGLATRRIGLRLKILAGIGIVLALTVVVQVLFWPNIMSDLITGYRIVIGRPIESGVIDHAVVRSEDGRTLLWAGVGEDFDITEFHLDAEFLRYGLGREYFYAPTKPQFVSRRDAETWLHDATPVLAVEVAGEIKVYPIPIVREHEIVNDVIGGRPVFAAFCVLANLGAIYDRQYGDETLTFAVSGYTYHDPEVWDGLDAFVLWDRDTESLWWPPIGKAVSGALIDTPMQILDEALWVQCNYGEAKARFGDQDFLVLDRVQRTVAPKVARRPLLRSADLESGATGDGAMRSIAPRWGENSDLGR